jgi:hypothetical protein
MQLECELCGAHYRADIADAHVEGGRLTFTCRNCGREVVVIGGPGDVSRRAGSLLPDQSEEAVAALPSPVESSSSGARPVEPAPELKSTGPELVLSVPEKKGLSPLILGLGVAAVLAVVFAVFVRPMLSAKPEGPETLKSVTQGPPAVAITPVPTVQAVAPSPAATVPVPEQAPVVQIKELRTPEAKPSPVPTAKREPAVRDAATVIDPGAIQEAFIRVRPLYRLCAVTEVTRDPEAKLGTIVASLTIAPTGAVTKVAFDRPDLASSQVGQCVRGALAKMTFPAFEGSPAVLRQPISLEVPGGR